MYLFEKYGNIYITYTTIYNICANFRDEVNVLDYMIKSSRIDLSKKFQKLVHMAYTHDNYRILSHLILNIKNYPAISRDVINKWLKNNDPKLHPFYVDNTDLKPYHKFLIEKKAGLLKLLE
jgi:hypothetical protein